MSVTFQNITCYKNELLLTFNNNDTGEAGFMILKEFKEPIATEVEKNRELDDRIRELTLTSENLKIVHFKSDKHFYLDQNLIMSEKMNRILVSTSLPSKNEFKIYEFDDKMSIT